MKNSNHKHRQSGVTLLLSLLVLSSILAISFSLATILFVEIQTSGDLVRTEPALYAANANTEEALFKIKRQVPSFSYTSTIGVVNSTAVETSFTDPVQQIRVPASSNTFSNTVVSYPIYTTPTNPSSGYGKIDISYPSQSSNYNVDVYVCEFDINYTGSYYTPGAACSDPNALNSYWAPTTALGGGVPYSLAPGVSKSIILDPTKQQQLILVNSAGVSDIYLQITTYDQSGNGLGLPYFGKIAVKISSSNAGVTRNVKVVIPSGGYTISSSTPSGISSAPVQQNTGDWSSGSSFNAVMASAPSNGNVMVCMVGTSGTQTVTGVSESNVAWHRAVASNVNENEEIWYGEVGASASPTITFNLSATPLIYRANCSEWSGVLTSGELDAAGTAGNSGSNSTANTATVTPTAGKNVLIVGMGRKAGTFSSGPTNGFTALTTSSGGWQYAYQVVPAAAGSYFTSWTWSTSSAYDSVIATLKGN